MSVITISNVCKSFGEVEVLKNFNDEFKDGEFITLLGPSGCGKTTMLRIIAGFEKPTSGEIKFDGVTVSGNGVFVPPEKREIGMVFQSYAVWPHMNVFDNVAYPLKIKKFKKDVIKTKVNEVLDTVHLSQYADRMPSQLSGGQQQRVALARALVAEPKLLLLDEPLSNLDAKLRESMRYEIKEIQKKLGITVVYVTHDQVEAMTMSDRVFVINRGVVQQVGTPLEIYRHPVNQFVADFVGKVNFVKAVAKNGYVEFEGVDEKLSYKGDLKGEVEVAIRPENIVVVKENGELKGEVVAIYYLGDEIDLRVKLSDTVTIRVITGTHVFDTIKTGDKIELNIQEYIVYPEPSDEMRKILT